MGRTAHECQQCGCEIYFEGICYSCREANERGRILDLSQDEIDAAIEQICNEIAETGELDKQAGLFIKLVDFRDIDTSRIAEIAFAKRAVYPAEIFKDAPDEVVNAMIDLVLRDDTDSFIASKTLSGLAVRGGEQVIQCFRELECNPRKWRENLYVDPSIYATEGGWSFGADGKVFETNFGTCYPIVRGSLAERASSPVKIGVTTDDTCPHCGCRVVNLMEIDGREARLDFLGIDGVVKAKCCPNCIAYTDDYFCRYSLDGESKIIPDEQHFITEDYFKDEGIKELTTNSYVLGAAPVPLRYAADWEGGSSIGGFAFWIQDCVIKKCPDCGRLMTYLAQIQWDTVLDGMEGNAYIEICKDCSMIAFLHQQT